MKRRPHSFKSDKPIYLNKYFWLFSFIFITGALALRFILFSDYFQIKNIQISGNSKVSNADLDNLVRNYVKSKILFLPTESIFLVNPEKVKSAILDSYPDIGTVSLSRKMPNSLSLTIEERKPEAVFNNQGAYFLIDKKGVAFETASTAADFLKIESSTPVKELKLGNQAINEQELGKIMEIETALENDLRIPITTATIISTERLNIKTAAGWDIYFNPQTDISWQIQKLKLALEKQITPAQQSKLEYIELRFGNQVYFR